MLLFCIFISPKSFASGNDCNNATNIISTTIPIPQDYLITNSDSTIWFSFSATTDRFLIFENTCLREPSTKIQKIEVFTGSCNALALMAVENFADKDLYNRKILLPNLTVGSVYLVKVKAVSMNKNISIAFQTLDVTAGCIGVT